MTANEFFNRFYFHDSLMESINFELSKLTLDIDLCWWKQKEYKKGEEEIKKIRVVFDHIHCFEFEGDISKVESDTIFEFFIMANDDYPQVRIVFGDNQIKVIEFQSDEVELHWMD